MNMTLIEMDGFLRGKCLPGDMKVNETNAEYLLRKMNELQQKLTESERYGRQADITIENLERKLEQLTAENAGMKANAVKAEEVIMSSKFDYWSDRVELSVVVGEIIETPATDAILAEVRASGADECVRQLVISDADDDFCDAPYVCAMVAHQFRQEAK